jgi:HTH-type transcriptional regulator / antitoxin HipB
MYVRSAIELGKLLRDRRIELGRSQEGIADSIGVSRQWLMKVERGHDGAEIGLVLRALKVLRLRLKPEPSLLRINPDGD